MGRGNKGRYWLEGVDAWSWVVCRLALLVAGLLRDGKGWVTHGSQALESCELSSHLARTSTLPLGAVGDCGGCRRRAWGKGRVPSEGMGQGPYCFLCLSLVMDPLGKCGKLPSHLGSSASKEQIHLKGAFIKKVIAPSGTEK